MRADVNGKATVALALAVMLAAGSAVGFQQAQPGGATGAQPAGATPAVAQSAGPIPGMDPNAAGKAGDEDPASRLRPFAEVSKGYEKVVSTADGQSFFGLWKRDRDGQMLAEFPRGWEGQKHFLAMTVAGAGKFGSSRTTTEPGGCAGRPNRSERGRAARLSAW